MPSVRALAYALALVSWGTKELSIGAPAPPQHWPGTREVTAQGPMRRMKKRQKNEDELEDEKKCTYPVPLAIVRASTSSTAAAANARGAASQKPQVLSVLVAVRGNPVRIVTSAVWTQSSEAAAAAAPRAPSLSKEYIRSGVTCYTPHTLNSSLGMRTPPGRGSAQVPSAVVVAKRRKPDHHVRVCIYVCMWCVMHVEIFFLYVVDTEWESFRTSFSLGIILIKISK